MDLSASIQFSAECGTEFNRGHIFLKVSNTADFQEDVQHQSW